MDQDNPTLETETMEPILPPLSPRETRLPWRVFRWIQEFGNQHADIKVKWLLSAGFVFIVSTVFTQVQFNNVNDHEREKIVAAAARDKYLSDLTNYNSAISARALCVDGVTRSDNNRTAWSELADLVAAAGLVDAAAEIRDNAVLSQKPRSIDDCPAIPEKPTPPDALAQLQGELLPTSTSVPTTTQGE